MKKVIKIIILPFTMSLFLIGCSNNADMQAINTINYQNNGIKENSNSLKNDKTSETSIENVNTNQDSANDNNDNNNNNDKNNNSNNERYELKLTNNKISNLTLSDIMNETTDINDGDIKYLPINDDLYSYNKDKQKLIFNREKLQNYFNDGYLITAIEITINLDQDKINKQDSELTLTLRDIENNKIKDYLSIYSNMLIDNKDIIDLNAYVVDNNYQNNQEVQYLSSMNEFNIECNNLSVIKNAKITYLKLNKDDNSAEFSNLTFNERKENLLNYLKNSLNNSNSSNNSSTSETNNNNNNNNMENSDDVKNENNENKVYMNKGNDSENNAEKEILGF